MGFVTLTDGTVIHASLLSPMEVKPSEYKMSVSEFKVKLKNVKSITFNGTAEDLLMSY